MRPAPVVHLPAVAVGCDRSAPQLLRDSSPVLTTTGPLTLDYWTASSFGTCAGGGGGSCPSGLCATIAQRIVSATESGAKIAFSQRLLEARLSTAARTLAAARNHVPQRRRRVSRRPPRRAGSAEHEERGREPADDRDRAACALGGRKGRSRQSRSPPARRRSGRPIAIWRKLHVYSSHVGCRSTMLTRVKHITRSDSKSSLRRECREAPGQWRRTHARVEVGGVNLDVIHDVLRPVP